MFHLFGKQDPEKIKLGTRVVRGPNWSHSYEDNGEGFLGTIVGLSDSDRRILVIWDTGRGGRYRGGPNQYDLRVFDNAPTDVFHKKTVCFTCSESPIYGMKWTCMKCNINLCTQCYMDDKHDVEHIFERTNTSKAGRRMITARNSAQRKIISKGIFVGAEVVVGPYVTNKNKNEDYELGYVEEITNWENNYHRGIIKVCWKDTEIETLHRLGAEGCVDIICSRLTETATGGTYYADHLPVIDFDSVVKTVEVFGFPSAVNLNKELPLGDIEIILPTELTFDMKVKEEQEVGEIWKGEWTWKIQQPVCIKRFKPGLYQDFIREASIMKLCNHDNVLKLYGITTSVEWIVMEVCYKWNLSEYLQIIKENEIKLNQILYIATQVACGMNYLGKKRILHRDLRAANVLINEELETKISGFHFARVLKEDEDEHTPPLGEKIPIKWTAPEAALHGKFTFKSDVWSFGILLVELTSSGQIPYPGIKNKDVLEMVAKGYKPLRPNSCSENMYEIMLSCLHISPDKRPSFGSLFDLFYNPFLSGEPEEEVDYSNPGQIQVDINRILQTEVTFDTKIRAEKNVAWEIWTGEWILKTRQPVCIKRFQPGAYQDFIREASIMKLCNHDNVLKLYGVTTTVGWIVMEVFYDWNLLEYLRIDKENEIILNQMLCIAAQVACGMNYLGKKRILHRDLRAANVLINDKLQTKISGFHCARVLKEDEDEYNPPKGERFPIKWTAPEAALYGKFTFKSDVWSFGILLVELTTLGQIPYPGMQYRDVLELVESGYKHPQPNKCPDNIYKIMLNCWHKSPDNRPSFDFLFDFFDKPFVPVEPEDKADYFNQEQIPVDIKRILPTELTFDKKISIETHAAGEIWSGEWILKIRKPVSIKRFQRGSYQDCIREASIMKLCNHDKVIHLYGITTTVDWIVMEVFYDWTLLQYLRIDNGYELDFNKMNHIAAQVACGMKYLGTKRILHKDLRAYNVLINDNHETKIYAFYHARVLEKDEDEYKLTTDEAFAVRWAATEVFYDSKYTFKSDVWSFGILLVELFTFGMVPYQGLDILDLVDQIQTGFRHERPDNCPENIYKIMLSCWQKVQENRPTFDNLFDFFVSAKLENEEDEKEEEEEEEDQEPSEIEVHSHAEEDEEEDNPEPSEIEVRSDASADQIQQSKSGPS